MTNQSEIPPHSYEAEQALIGGILAYNDAYYRCATIVRSNDFADSVHSRVWEAIGDLLRRGSQANFLTLQKRFDQDLDLHDAGGSRYLAKLENTVVPIIAIEDYAATVHDLAVRRRAIVDIQEALHALHHDHESTITTLLADQMEALAERRAEIERSATPAPDSANQAFRDYKSPVAKHPTGIECLDRSFGGGFHAGRLYGIGANEKSGKTALLGTISRNLNMAGTKHLFVCLEVDSTEVMQRMLAREVDVPALSIMNGHADELALADAVAKVPDNLIFEDAHGCTREELRAIIMSAIACHGITGFMVDYWQLVGGQSQRETEEKHLRDTAYMMTSICRRHGVWGLVPSQLNSDGKTFGGKGLRLACDWYGTLNRPGKSHSAWIETGLCRYGPVIDVGTEPEPALWMHYNGPWFQDVADADFGKRCVG